MGKNEKKGKKGTKKKKQSKTSQKDKVTFAEALLTYQIQMKEARIEELLAEVKQIEEKNARYKERNERLKAEQTGHVKELLSQAKAQEQELAKKEVVNREQVDEMKKEKWELIHQKEILFEEIRREMNGLEKQMMLTESEKDYWLEYKNVGSREHAKHLHLLEEEMNDMKQNYTDIDEYFRKSLEKTKDKLDKETERRMDQTREIATLDAVKHIDAERRKEIKENNWLKKEVAIYRKDVHNLEESVYKIEQENVQLISRLFDCRLHDLHISRRTFLTQVSGLDFPADGLLEDLAGEDRGQKSDLLAAGESDVSAGREETDSAITLDLRHLLTEDEKDFKEYVQLGPLERKLLSIEGQAKPIHRESQETESPNNSCNQSRIKWAVTPRMISALPQ
ncbi:coiled-coil domain-containing protein 83 isoform X2 [Mixophyes fleayi]|uniref:coiled-coil domain-containing protein 83 isoform X2 n=1 Tax=Mixophyes fleayi TaxID=3061075 RepID=UPI003F4DE196